MYEYQVIGFSKPVDNLPILNVAKAGQAIPLKFRVLDYLGQPVSGLPYLQTLTVRCHAPGTSRPT